MSKYVDLTGMVFGRLTVLYRFEKESPVSWICLCECGNEKKARAGDLKRGSVKSCGCLKGNNQNIGKTHCKNGHEFTPENTRIKKDGGRECKACMSKHKAKYVQEHPEKRKESWRKSLQKIAGFTPQLYLERLEDQDNCCAICGVEFSTLARVPDADHKHVLPPQPRGLLCHFCNAGLGFFKDNPAALESAAKYLRKYGEE